MSSDETKTNVDERTVAGFGDEWSRFDQAALSDDARTTIFADYFSIFPWERLPDQPRGMDLGCGSGRWAAVVAPRVTELLAVDASEEALSVAERNLSGDDNVRLVHASVDDLPVEDDSLDFAYSLGVLHHVPDTPAAISSLVSKLKPGAPCLLYLYYAFDNRGPWFRTLWRASDWIRRRVSIMPHGLRFWVSQLLAVLVYWPLARSARLLDRLNLLPDAWPLAYYRAKPFYVMRTDALDRFGTRLEQRFTREEITEMMNDAGLMDITFSDHEPYWCAVGIKR